MQGGSKQSRKHVGFKLALPHCRRSAPMVWEDQDKERGRAISNLAWDVTTPLVF
jgi:hypothetical protein